MSSCFVGFDLYACIHTRALFVVLSSHLLCTSHSHAHDHATNVLIALRHPWFTLLHLPTLPDISPKTPRVTPTPPRVCKVYADNLQKEVDRLASVSQ